MDQEEWQTIEKKEPKKIFKNNTNTHYKQHNQYSSNQNQNQNRQHNKEYKGNQQQKDSYYKDSQQKFYHKDSQPKYQQKDYHKESHQKFQQKDHHVDSTKKFHHNKNDKSFNSTTCTLGTLISKGEKPITINPELLLNDNNKEKLIEEKVQQQQEEKDKIKEEEKEKEIKIVKNPWSQKINHSNRLYNIINYYQKNLLNSSYNIKKDTSNTSTTTKKKISTYEFFLLSKILSLNFYNKNTNKNLLLQFNSYYNFLEVNNNINTDNNDEKDSNESISSQFTELKYIPDYDENLTSLSYNPFKTCEKIQELLTTSSTFSSNLSASSNDSSPSSSYLSYYYSPRGIINTGNSCYRNSVIQSLFSIRKFNYLLKELSKYKIIKKDFVNNKKKNKKFLWNELLLFYNNFYIKKFNYYNILTILPINFNKYFLFFIKKFDYYISYYSSYKTLEYVSDSDEENDDEIKAIVLDNVKEIEEKKIIEEKILSNNNNVNPWNNKNTLINSSASDSNSASASNLEAEFLNFTTNSQEDAMEFLTFFINNLDEELVEIEKEDSNNNLIQKFYKNDLKLIQNQLESSGYGSISYSSTSSSTTNLDLPSPPELSSSTSTSWQTVKKVKNPKKKIKNKEEYMIEKTNTKKSIINNNYNIIKQTFNLIIKNKISYNKKNSRVVYESFNNFLLNNNNNKEITISEALDNYFKVEKIEGGITKKPRLASLPEVLILQLHRFSFNLIEGTPEKKKFSFEFSNQIEIKPKYLTKTLRNKLKNEKISSSTSHTFVDNFSEGESDSDSDYYSDSDHEAEPTTSSSSSSSTLVTYTLESAILHHGEEATGGHYTCLVKDSRGQWLHMNDEEVKEVNEQDVFGTIFRTPVYLLFYSKD